MLRAESVLGVTSPLKETVFKLELFVTVREFAVTEL